KPPDDQIHRAYGVRVVLFFVLVVIVAAALFLIYQFTQTLYQLHIAEGERDHWQRPDDVIDSLKLKDGDTVADVGCAVHNAMSVRVQVSLSSRDGCCIYRSRGANCNPDVAVTFFPATWFYPGNCFWRVGQLYLLRNHFCS